MLSLTEENYLKAIFSLSNYNDERVSTNAISEEMGTSAASVSDMLKKLLDKGYVKYEKYKGVRLSSKGVKKATNVLRKHRLWETFLVENLEFNWSEVHDIAEELEHIKSNKLINRLEKFLGYPKFDPHGDPIPSENGKFPNTNTISLDKVNIGTNGNVMGVSIDDKLFLDYLTKLNIQIGSRVHVLNKNDFDQSLTIKINNKTYQISHDVSKNILIKKR
tara:strand:+ start:2587 stop:3243 length:657 start_codon:yes stop_codon:yes gene_type:complete